MNGKKLLSLFIATVMLLLLMPLATFAAIGDGYGQCPHHTEHTNECGYLTSYTCMNVCEICRAQTEALVEALPSMIEISEMDAEEKAEVFTAVDNIDRAKLNLSDAGRDEIDWTKYNEACFVLYMPDGYFGGWGTKIDCINGIEVPLNDPQFAFLNEDGNRQSILYTDNTTPELLDVDEDGKSGFFYLPAGTYIIEEFVEGDWNFTTKVNGVPAANNTFTGVVGGIYEIDMLNTAASPAKVIAVGGAETPFDTIDHAVAAASAVQGSTLVILENCLNEISIQSGNFTLDATGFTCSGKVTVAAGANIKITGGTFNVPGNDDTSISNHGKLTVTGGDFGHVVMEDGFESSSITGGTFKSVTAYTKSSTDDSTNLTISGGSFNKVLLKKSGTAIYASMSKLLQSGYAFRQNGTGTWLYDDSISYDGSNYISPYKKPIQDVATQLYCDDYEYGNNVEMKITEVLLAPGYNEDDVTYKWFKGTAEVNPPCTSNTYNTIASNVGVREDYYCHITLDGYVVKENFYFTAVKATPTPPTVPALQAIYGQTLYDISSQLPEGFSWEENVNTYVGNVGRRSFNATYTPSDITHYTNVTHIPIAVEVAKADAVITTPPEAKNRLTYTGGDAMELVNPGIASGGTMLYSLTETDTFTADIPKGASAKQYRVYYKVAGDDNHYSTNVFHVDVIIDPKVLGDGCINAIDNQTYTKSAIRPTVTVMDGATVVPVGEYSVSYSNNIEVGTATVTVTDVAGGNYTVNATASFDITSRSVEGGIVGTFAPLTYDGTSQTPSATVTIAGIEATGYWSPVQNVYDKTVFTATGNFTGTILNIDPGMSQAQVIPNTAKTPSALVKQGKTLETAEVIDAEFFASDGITPLEGDFEWENKTKVMNAGGQENVIFTPTNVNYAPKTIPVDVAVKVTNVSRHQYRVSFDSNGGSAVSSQAVMRNSKANEPEVPSRDGFTFAGWYSDSELSQKFSFDTVITKNITLYAKWSTEEDGSFGKNDPESTDKDNEKTDDGDNQGTGQNTGADPSDGQSKDEWENPFVDVKDNDWFFEGVRYVQQNGLMTGTSGNAFSPNETLTRAMLVTILYRADGSPAVDKSAVVFSDVVADSYYSSAVIWAQQNGIVNGTGDKTFSPDEPITREQMATIIKRYAEKKGFDVSVGENTNILSYSDAFEISEYAFESISYAVGSGLMKGKTESTINPKDSVTRAETATILKRLLENK